ncbi:hypothetical protein CN096_27790 [Sinorhizobium meliloti]|nr:hypothetical protein CN096_27790 [Sinorhizobium meliloti]
MLVTGIQQRRVCGAEESFQPKDLGWLDSCDRHRNEGLGRSGVTPMSAAGMKGRLIGRIDGPHLRPHPCACHRDGSSAASAARKSLFSPITWAGWIPVTGTGMRRWRGVALHQCLLRV